MITAKVTTYQTAVKNGFFFGEFVEACADYGWLPIEPKGRDTTVKIDHYGFEDTALDDTADGPTLIAEGQVFSDYQYTLIVAKCSCGCQWGDAIDTDENSVASWLNCPDCDATATPDQYELNTGVEFRRMLRGAKKAGK